MSPADTHTLAAGHPGFLSPTGVEIVFLLVGLATLGAALVTVTTKQLVHAALWLVAALGGVAVEYLLLTAEFIAWVQVLIYVGSVVVLLLFGLMLTRAPIGHSPDADSGNRWVALAVALAAAATLVTVVVDAFRATWIDLDGPVAGSPRPPGQPSSGTGCCPSRRCPFCCWPRWSARSCSPGRHRRSASPSPAAAARPGHAPRQGADAPRLSRRARRPSLLRRRSTGCWPAATRSSC